MTEIPEGFVSLTRLPSGAFLLVRADGARVLASADARGGLWMDVRKEGLPTARLTEAPRARGVQKTKRAQDDGRVLAPTGGVLRSLAVCVGDAVQPGAVLGHVEAMKMQIELRARVGGTVTAIDAQAGDRVERGGLLLRITP